MSTYSTNLGLTLIGTGEQAGTWGSTTNTNLGTLLEQSISGYSTTAMVSDANTTITIPNGASGEARNMYIEIPSSLTLTAIRTLTVPTNKKLYFVYNNNNSSYGVIVKAGSSTFSGTGSISTTNMTIASVTGTISVGMIIAGTGVTAGTTIVSQTSGTAGGAGVYVVSVSQTVASTTITGQTGVYVPAGAKMGLVSNGTEIFPAENYLQSLTLGTPLAISQGGTGQTTALIPSQSGNASKYLRSNGVNTSWDQISLNSSAFTGTGIISGTNLTISAAYGGALVPGSIIYGTGITSGTTIVSQTSSEYVNSALGGNGVYVIDTSHTLATPFTINSYADASGTLPPSSGGTGYSGNNTLSLLSGNLGTSGVFQGTGYIIGATLYVTAYSGTNLLYPNAALTGVTLAGASILSGTTIYSQIGGTTGGVGTYNLYVNGGNNITQTWASSGTPATFVGAYPSTLTFTAPSTVTLPTTGTLATLDGTETLTNKTIQFPTSASVSAAGTTQGTGTALTLDHNVISTAASGTGVVLPTATAGRRIVVENKGANAVKIYPASGATVDALAANASITLPVDGVMFFNASSTTQWYSSYNLYTSATAAAGVTSFSAGSTGLSPATATTGAITLAGTLAVANGGTGLTSGTSGGVPYYSASGTIASSAALAASALVVGGGAGATPATVTTGTGVLTALGLTTNATGGVVTTDGTATLTNKTITTPAITFSTAATVTAGTNAQGQGALTNDYNVITTASSNPSGVTLPTATVGRRVIVINKGANPVNVYPASGGTIDSLASNAAILLPVGAELEFNASSTTQWYSSINLLANGIGVAQTWTDVTSSRAASTTYTNSTGKAIMVSIYPANNNSGGYDFTVNSLVINHAYANAGYGFSGIMVIVPIGGTYSFAGPFQYWRELS